MGEFGQVASGGNWATLAHREPLCELGKGAPSSPRKPTGPALISDTQPTHPNAVTRPPERGSAQGNVCHARVWTQFANTF